MPATKTASSPQWFLHVIVALGFAALTIAWTFPLVLHLSTHLPGAAIGDNALFLWNFWWMRTARTFGSGFFHTPYLFVPVGADLTLHTHTALPAFVGATLFGELSLATALNVTTMVSLTLNGFCAYLLAWRSMRQRSAAILAGIVFGTSPYIAAHLNGHFNLTTAWTVPLFALGVVDAVRGSIGWAVFAGVVLVATAYIDYYYLIYEVAFACCVLLLTARQWSVTLNRRGVHSRWFIVLVAAIALDLIVIVVIGVTGGFDGHVGPFGVSAHETFNPLQVLWVLIAIALWVRFMPQVRASRRDEWSAARATSGAVIMLWILVLGAAPLLWNGFNLLVGGQYVTQHYDWRSAPIGIDILTLFLGNPFQSLWGGAPRLVYTRLGIDLVESGAWLGIAPVALAAVAVRRQWADPIVRHWVALGGVFVVWAMGSHVHIAGRNIGLIMPEVVLRYVPIAANARMPGRAMVVVYLALAVLAAAGIASFRGRHTVVAWSAVVALVLADFWIAPFPIASIECPPIYSVLRDQPERGALAELPLALGDGLGNITPVDRHMLVCQTIHQRPVVGGALARLPAHVLTAYKADPLITAWLQLSGARPDVVPGGRLPDAASAAQRLAADGIAFVMLNRRSASAELRDYVEHVLLLTVVAHDDERVLYRSRY